VTQADVIPVIPGMPGTGDPEPMTGVIDYWCNLFTPEGIRVCFTEQEELAEVFRWWKLEDQRHGEALAQLETLGLGEEARAWLVRDTARKVFKL
jgi:hypothetical protein